MGPAAPLLAVVVNSPVCPHPVRFSVLVHFLFYCLHPYPLPFLFYIYVSLVVPSLAQGFFTSRNSLRTSLVMCPRGPGHPFCSSFGSLFPPSSRWFIWPPEPFVLFRAPVLVLLKGPAPPYSLSTFRFSRFSGPEGDPVWATGSPYKQLVWCFSHPLYHHQVMFYESSRIWGILSETCTICMPTCFFSV